MGDSFQNKDDMLEKDVIIKYFVLPPKRLYHPVLPYRCNNKLLFCLCRTCAIEQNITTECNHETVSEWAFVDKWVMDKIRLAVEKGSVVIEVHEVYGHQITKYDPQTGEGGIFVQFINTFLKLKAEAS
jgi:hypothetical protein